MPASASRLEPLDALRGAAVLGVVAIHVLAGPLLFPSRYSGAELGGLIAFDLLARFSVPTFLLLSGLLLARSAAARPLGYAEFLRRRAWRVVPPYLVWTAIYTWRGSADYPVAAFGRHLLVGDAAFHTYFVAIILHLYLAFPLLHRLCRPLLGDRRRALALVVGAFVLKLVLCRWPLGVAGDGLWRAYLRGGPVAAVNWGPYFLMGLGLAPWCDRLPELRGRWLDGLLALATLAVIAGRRWVVWHLAPDGNHAGQWAVFGWDTVGTPLAALATLRLLWPVLCHPDAARLTAGLARLGRAGYGVYLAHVLVMQVLGRCVPYVILTVLAPAVPAAVLVVTGISWLLVAGLGRLPGGRWWSGIDGPPLNSARRAAYSRTGLGVEESG